MTWKRLGDTPDFQRVAAAITKERQRLKDKYPDGIPDYAVQCPLCGQAPCPCSLCHGAGRVLPYRWEYGKPEPRDEPCPQCNASTEILAQRIERLAEGSGMQNHRAVTFATRRARGGQTEQWALGQRWAANPTPPCFWMCGHPQTGKTTLAHCMANAFLDQGQSVVLRYAEDLLDDIKESFNPRADQSFAAIKSALSTTRLLLVDDLGREHGTEWVDAKLVQIFRARIEADSRPTIITTNWTMEELDQHMNWLYHRVLNSNLTTMVLFGDDAIQGPLQESVTAS